MGRGFLPSLSLILVRCAALRNPGNGSPLIEHPEPKVQTIREAGAENTDRTKTFRGSYEKGFREGADMKPPMAF